MSDQTKRVRSPNYPAISLADAAGRLERLFGRINKFAAPKEAVAKALGYGGWNGASAAVASALLKYGLLERVGDDAFKITARAMEVLYGTAEEKAAALKNAALAPLLYRDLFAAFPGAGPHDDVLRPWLIKRGFAPSATAGVITGYRETLDVAKLASNEGEEQNPGDAITPERAMVPVSTSPIPSAPLPPLDTAGTAAIKGREERIMDDDGNSIVVQFPFEPTLETYDFLRDYLEFRIARLRRTTQAKVTEDDS